MKLSHLLLDGTYAEQIREQTWLRNNPIQGCVLPPRIAEVDALFVCCPVYPGELTMVTILELGENHEFICAICGFEHIATTRAFED